MTPTIKHIISQVKKLSRDEQLELIEALTETATPEEGKRCVDPFGQFAYVPTSVDAFLARKAAEIDFEDR